MNKKKKKKRNNKKRKMFLKAYKFKVAKAANELKKIIFCENISLFHDFSFFFCVLWFCS